MNITEAAAALLWHTLYPDRQRWDTINATARAEWIRFIEVAQQQDAYHQFGQAMWSWLRRHGGDIFNHEDSEEFCQHAHAAGLVQRVIYDPAVHGEGINADPGTEIWWWGNQPSAATPRLETYEY